MLRGISIQAALLIEAMLHAEHTTDDVAIYYYDPA
jgi:hypothetical protein